MPDAQPDPKAALPFRDDSSERELATNPWSSPTPDPKTHEDQVAEFEAKEAARAEQREEHNTRIAGE